MSKQKNMRNTEHEKRNVQETRVSNFQYSSFISYRRNDGDEVFMKKFKDIIASEAFKVTNIKNVFFDENSIQWGNEFDEKIYDGIVACYFFIPFYHNTYLHEDNLWCAKELYRAIEVEKKIRDNHEKGYCFILPIIYRGSASAFPTCIGNKNAKEIKLLRHIVLSNKSSAALEQFKDDIYEIFLQNFKLLTADVSFTELCADIPIPTDDEIKAWIREQKEQQRVTESNNPPRMKKNEY
ncbi:MAG: toll/interleukin-1 receptor domain-containing protein [Ignavibacteriae bacterium]|nr:toll/interleukin-1 receptor domain-containing protein [Ignavibacteriota bacterium]